MTHLVIVIYKKKKPKFQWPCSQHEFGLQLNSRWTLLSFTTRGRQCSSFCSPSPQSFRNSPFTLLHLSTTTLIVGNTLSFSPVGTNTITPTVIHSDLPVRKEQRRKKKKRKKVLKCHNPLWCFIWGRFPGCSSSPKKQYLGHITAQKASWQTLETDRQTDRDDCVYW